MRSLSPEAREERRRLVVRLRKKGLTYEAIAEQTGLTRTGVFDICKRVAEQGAAGLVDKPVGRKLGTGRALKAEQEAQVQKLIRDKTPDQLKMGFALWSRSAVRELIRERFGVKLQVRAVGNYLGRWGYTPQKPITQGAIAFITRRRDLKAGGGNLPPPDPQRDGSFKKRETEHPGQYWIGKARFGG